MKGIRKSLSMALVAGLAASTTGLPVPAQVPGVPSTQPQASSASSPLLTGRVKTDISTGEKYLSQGKWPEAEGIFRDAIVNNPTDIQAAVGLGIALANEFKLDAADTILDRVLSTDPSNATAYAGKSICMLNRLQSSSGTVRSLRDQYLKQSEDYARKAVQLAPQNAEAHLALGQVLKEENRLDEAAAELNSAISADQQLSYAYSTLGMIKLAQNSVVEAGENCRRAIALNPGNSTAHYGLGASLLKQGQLDDAIKELNTSLYQYPNSWPVRMALGDAYQKQGNTVAALQQYQLATLIKPEVADAYTSMANIHQTRGDYELALADLRSGLSQSPYDIGLRQRIADNLLQIERTDDAIKEYRTILQLSANDNLAVKGLSQALYLKAQKATVGAMLQSNDFSTATKALDEAIKLNPSDMELRLAMAKLNSLSGTTPQLPDGQPTNDGERVVYGQAQMANGDFVNGSQQFSTVVKDLNDPNQLYAVADVALMSKSLESAEAAYKKGQTNGGVADRASKGLAQINKFRANAKEATIIADELAKKRQWQGAIAKYNEAIASNPTYAPARLGLAESLEEEKDTSESLAECAKQLGLYLTVANDIPEKEREKLTERVEKLKEKSLKLRQREEARGR